MFQLILLRPESMHWRVSSQKHPLVKILNLKSDMRQCDLVLITNNSPLRSLLFVPWTTNVCIISLEDQAEGQLDIVH